MKLVKAEKIEGGKFELQISVDKATFDEAVTNAFQQPRVDTKNYNVNAYPTKYQYAQGIKVMFNVGIRF